MVAERGVWPHQEQIPEKICEQIVDVHVPQVVGQVLEVPKTACRDRSLACTAEQILDAPVPEMVKQLVEAPKTIHQDRIQQRTVEHMAADTPVPRDVEEPAEFFKAFSQDRVQLRFGGQIIENPAIPLAEKIVELPVIQTEEKTQQGVNTSVQHVFNTVEKRIIQEKINQVTIHVEIPLLQFTDKVVDNPVVAQRQISMVLVVQKSTEISQLQYCDEAINVTVVQVVRVPQSQVVAETAQQITDKVTDVPAVLVVPVPQVRMVKKTVEDPQFQIVEKTVENSETQTIQGLDMPASQVQVVAKTVQIPQFPFVEKIAVIPEIRMALGAQTSESLNGEFDAGHDEKSEQDALARQPHSSRHNNQQHSTRQAMQEKPGEREREERERGRKGERRKMEAGRKPEEGRDAEVEKREQVNKDETGWTVGTRSKKQRERIVQIFVKVDGGKTSVMEMETSDKVDDIVKNIPISDQDVYVTSGGRILRRRDKLESCEVRDGRWRSRAGCEVEENIRTRRASQRETRAEVGGRIEERQRSSDSGM